MPPKQPGGGHPPAGLTATDQKWRALGWGVCVGVLVVVLSYGTLWEIKPNWGVLDSVAASAAVDNVLAAVSQGRSTDGAIVCDVVSSDSILVAIQKAVEVLEGDFDSSDRSQRHLARNLQAAATDCSSLAADAVTACSDENDPAGQGRQRLCLACADLALVADAEGPHLGALVAAADLLLARAESPGNQGSVLAMQSLKRRAAIFEELIALRPGSAELRVGYASALGMAGQWESAVGALASATRLDTNHVHRGTVQWLQAAAAGERLPFESDWVNEVYLAPGVRLLLVPASLRGPARPTA